MGSKRCPWHPKSLGYTKKVSAASPLPVLLPPGQSHSSPAAPIPTCASTALPKAEVGLTSLLTPAMALGPLPQPFPSPADASPSFFCPLPTHKAFRSFRPESSRQPKLHVPHSQALSAAVPNCRHQGDLGRGRARPCRQGHPQLPLPFPSRGPGQSAGQCGNGCRVMRLPRAGMESCTTSQLILLAQHPLCVPQLRWQRTARGWTGCPEPPRPRMLMARDHQAPSLSP